ncbi:WG repeat-containing protein [Paenibacillus sp. R14(2021)]|uniref:WG repeat-containing protein n=1 Tax=Paenibacillus sp. R14(2021) TaxID=2859228 RepID=UPI001C6169CA|nr:WG repeat-containing protein [Paenibacillus sp. R14(2021)]
MYDLRIRKPIQLQIDEPRAAIGLFPASVKLVGGTKWGYIDSSGRMALAPQFSDARDFQQNGLAIAADQKGSYGAIDASGCYRIPPVYDSINDFAERRAVAIDKQGFKLINERGKVLTKRAYPFIADMKEGRSVFYVTDAGSDAGNSRYGYLDAQGKEIIPAQFEEAGDFKNRKAVIKIKDNEYALIGPTGRRLADYPYAYVGPLGDGMLAFQRDTAGKYGYLNERGDVVLQPAYTSAFTFRNDRAIVNTAEDYKSSYGVINKAGTFIVKAAYNDIRDLGNDRLALGRAIDPEQPFVGSMYAIADWNGNLLSAFLYQDVSDFDGELASVTDGKETYFIDRSGKPAPGYPNVSGIGTLTLEEGGLIKAFVDRRLSYLNRAGRIIWKQNTVIPLQPPYFVKEMKYKPNPDYLVYYPQVEGMASGAAQATVNTRLKEMSQVKPIPSNKKLDYSYIGDFEVAFFKMKLLQLELSGYNFPFGAAHGMPTKTYAIINLSNGRMYALQDLFKPGSDYVKELSAIVGRQIQDDPQYEYVFPGSYKGIRPDQPFYVTENALHLYFEPYEIAPYAAGFPTFTIPFAQIRGIINTSGEFWKLFHS